MSICPTVYLWFQTCLLLALCLYQVKGTCLSSKKLCLVMIILHGWVKTYYVQTVNPAQEYEPIQQNPDLAIGTLSMQFCNSRDRSWKERPAVFKSCLTFCTSIIIEYLWWARVLVSGDVWVAWSLERVIPLKTLKKVKRYRPHVHVH